MIQMRSVVALAALSLLGASALWSNTAQAQCVPLATLGTAVTQDFNTLASAGTSGVTPAGWFFAETGSNANALYNTGTGSGNAGDTYSFGAAAAVDRAFGGLLSGSLTPTVGACFTNNTGGDINGALIAYVGEQWRLGTAARVDRLDFQYSLNATSLTTGTWVNVDALDFVAPTTTPVGALDGNSAANRTALSNSVGLSANVAAGSNLWIRWSDFNATGADDGLAVDDFAFTPLFTNADLSIVMTDTPDPVTAGTNLSYLVTMTNTGPDAALNARFSVPLAAGTTLVSTTPSAGGVCTAVSPIVCTWAGATASAEVRSATIVVAVAADAVDGTFLDSSATAASDTPDADPADNLSTVSTSVVTSANLAITVTDTPDPVIAGTPLTYAVSISNAGPSDAQDVSFSLPLAAGTSFVSVVGSAGANCNAATPVTCSWAGATAPGVNRTATVVVNVAANVADATLLIVAGTATSTTSDPATGNNTGEASTTVNANANLSITLTDSPDPVVAGTNLTYLATLSNAGPSDAQDAAISLPLPAGTSLVSTSASAGGICAGSTTVTCTWAGTTAPGVIRTATIVVLVSSAQTAALSATATAASATNDLDPADNSATATTAVEVQADLSVTLTDAPDPVIAGTQLTYTAVISNVGPSDATGVVLTLPTPANTSFVSGSVSGGGSCAGSPVVCTVSGSIAPATSRTVSIVMLVAPSAAEGSTISATVTLTAISPDPNQANNTAGTTTAVITRADLLLGFSASVGQALINVPVTFTATSLNQGPSDAQGVSVTITLTPDFRFSSLVATGATCTTPQVGNTGAIVCTWAGATAPGVTRTLTVVAFSNVEGATGVSASTTSGTIDPVPNNNSGNVVVQVGYLIEEIPTLSGYGLILLGLMFGLIGFVAVRRQA
jgi:uncharacterized repeat protein (TIGR01451 family)